MRSSVVGLKKCAAGISIGIAASTPASAENFGSNFIMIFDHQSCGVAGKQTR